MKTRAQPRPFAKFTDPMWAVLVDERGEELTASGYSALSVVPTNENLYLLFGPAGEDWPTCELAFRAKGLGLMRPIEPLEYRWHSIRKGDALSFTLQKGFHLAS